jgi:hypothetical protein
MLSFQENPVIPDNRRRITSPGVRWNTAIGNSGLLAFFGPIHPLLHLDPRDGWPGLVFLRANQRFDFVYPERS